MSSSDAFPPPAGFGPFRGPFPRGLSVSGRSGKTIPGRGRRFGLSIPGRFDKRRKIAVIELSGFPRARGPETEDGKTKTEKFGTNARHPGKRGVIRGGHGT
jgi:hypothetical protein